MSTTHSETKKTTKVPLNARDAAEHDAKVSTKGSTGDNEHNRREHEKKAESHEVQATDATGMNEHNRAEHEAKMKRLEAELETEDDSTMNEHNRAEREAKLERMRAEAAGESVSHQERVS